MAENEALLAAVLARPYDDEPRLAYAAERAAQRDPRGELIRLQVGLARPFVQRDVDPDSPAFMAEVERDLRRQEGIVRERELRESLGPMWAEPVAIRVDDYGWDRGFVADVTLSASRFLEEAETLFALAPIVHVRLTNVKPVAEMLFTSPRFAYVRALSMIGEGLTGDDLRPLTRSQTATRLWWLDLGRNRLDYDAVRMLAESPLRKLAYVGLTHNPSDPRETAGVEGLTIVDARLPDEGKRLEAEVGFVPWLHFPTGSMADYSPDPLRAPPVRR